MNALQITAIVCGAVLLTGCILMLVAWFNDRWQRRDHRQEPTLEQDIRTLGRSNTVQLIITSAIGLATGAAYYAGWCATW